jgi:hypothetical protein
MERLAVRAGELCEVIISGMRDRGCDVRTIAIEITAAMAVPTTPFGRLTFTMPRPGPAMIS